MEGRSTCHGGVGRQLHGVAGSKVEVLLLAEVRRFEEGVGHQVPVPDVGVSGVLDAVGEGPVDDVVLQDQVVGSDSADGHVVVDVEGAFPDGGSTVRIGRGVAHVQEGKGKPEGSEISTQKVALLLALSHNKLIFKHQLLLQSYWI